MGALLAVVLVAQAVAATVRLTGGDGGGNGVPAIAAGAARVVSDQLLSEGRIVRATVTPESARPPAHAVYGDAGRADPLGGPMLAVGSGFHDNVPVFPTAKTPGFRTVELGDRRVAVGRDRAWTWVTWDLPDCTDECQGYTAGRNLGEAQVLEAARGASADLRAPSIAAASLPPGLSHLVTGEIHLDGFVSAGGQFVSWTTEAGGAVLRVLPDARMASLVRFWVDGGPVRIRGQAGSAGSVAAVGLGGDTQGRAWSEGGRTLLVITAKLSGEEVDRFVGGLRAAADGEWDRLRARVLDVSSETVLASCYDPGEAYTALGRREARFRWAVGMKVGRLDQFSFCDVILTPDHRSLGSAGGPRPAPGRMSVTTSGIGGATDPIGLFMVGVAPPGTARVRVEPVGGGTLDAELAGVGPRPGERYYAVFVEGDIRRRPAVVALDASGAELARLAGGAPT